MCSFALRQLGLARVVIGRLYPAAGGVSSRHPILCDSGFTCWYAPGSRYWSSPPRVRCLVRPPMIPDIGYSYLAAEPLYLG